MHVKTIYRGVIYRCRSPGYYHDNFPLSNLYDKLLFPKLAVGGEDSRPPSPVFK